VRTPTRGHEWIRPPQELLEQGTQYGDIGRHLLGMKGRVLVDASLVITQFGFCVAYFIFLGNTLYDLTEKQLELNVRTALQWQSHL